MELLVDKQVNAEDRSLVKHLEFKWTCMVETYLQLEVSLPELILESNIEGWNKAPPCLMTCNKEAARALGSNHSVDMETLQSS
jgi:hypothetical protein